MSPNQKEESNITWRKHSEKCECSLSSCCGSLVNAVNCFQWSWPWRATAVRWSWRSWVTGRRRRGGWVKASCCRSATPPASEASPPWQEPGQTWSSSDRWASTNSQQRHPNHVTTCPVRPDSQLPVCSSQALPSERWRDQLCLLVCLCFPHHGADADPGLVLAAVPLRGLQVSHQNTTPNITVASPTAPTAQLYSYKHDWFCCVCASQPEEDVGLRCGPVAEGAGSIRGHQGRAFPSGTHELRRVQRSGSFHPHGGAVVHTRPALHGRLGHAHVQLQSRVSTSETFMSARCWSCFSILGVQRAPQTKPKSVTAIAAF